MDVNYPDLEGVDYIRGTGVASTIEEHPAKRKRKKQPFGFQAPAKPAKRKKKR